MHQEHYTMLLHEVLTVDRYSKMGPLRETYLYENLKTTPGFFSDGIDFVELFFW